MKPISNGAAAPNSRHAGARHRLPSHPATLRPGDGRDDSEHPFEEGAHDAIGADLRQRLISNAAFELYAQRGFVDGHDVEDWLSAEARIDHLQLGPKPTETE